MDTAERSGSSEQSDQATAALTRLEKLRIDHGRKVETEISEELIKDNQRRQDDELLALEAIYQDNLRIFDKQDDLLFFQISVHCDVPEGFKVSAKFHSGTGTFKPSNNADVASDQNSDEGFLYSFGVQFLPPIVLTCILPKSYPSHEPPYFTIGTEFLNESKISSICDMLDSIWSEQLGEEVIFQWADWLQNSSLSHLEFNKELVLSVPKFHKTGTKDTRTISVNFAPERIIPFMMHYNEEKCHEAFLKNMHLCLICFSEYLGSEFIKLPCQHLFCSNCMETYSKMHVKEGSVTKLSCPDTSCGAHVPPIVLRRLLDDQDYDRWESLLLQKTLDAMEDVVYCPRCETACLEDSKMNDAQCSKCFFSFCTLCKDRRHVGEKCMDAEARLQILQERLKCGGSSEQQKKERELINEVLSRKEVLRDAKQCPKCGMGISRTEGCNKMLCSNCSQPFCYKCTKPIHGYDHFREGCELFPREEIVRWEENLNPRQIEAQVRAELYGGFGRGTHPCPNCGQRNSKVGNNNHLFCWACQSRYCALCHKVVKRSSEHFTRKGCRQHTADP